MELKLRELSKEPDLLASGHRLCPGCAESIAVRLVLHAAGPNTVVATATGCLEISTSPYPQTAWRVPWVHNAFENAAATISGVEAAARVLQRRGKLGEGRINLIAFAGDGGAYDIGLQSLSGALERGHRFLFVCLNNEAYMNTGIQRSSATPLGGWTTTSPIGSQIKGKRQTRKDLTFLVAAHENTYAAQASVHAWKDLMRKTERALNHDGPSFINILTPCPRGWRTDADQTVALGRLAAETCVWPLYEAENQRWALTYRPREKKSVIEWIKAQGRLNHLALPENAALAEELQRQVDAQWERLLSLTKAFPPTAAKAKATEAVAT